MQILDERLSTLVRRERSLLEELAAFLRRFEAAGADVELVRQKQEDLDEFFLLVIVGEFNSGKSAFINALLGSEVAVEGPTPTTNRITILRYSEQPTERERRDGVLERGYPSPFLREVAIVDTPGTNAILRHHEELSRGFVPRSDLVLFVTSVDRPYTESEREYLEIIRDWGKKIVLVVNKVDLLTSQEEIENVREFVEQGVRSLLGITPPVFLVSARTAKRARATDSSIERDALRQASGFDALERFVSDLLDEEGRVRLKLESPLGVANQICERYRQVASERMGLLEQDFRTAQNIEAQLEAYREDMRRDFESRLAEIDNVIHRMNDRADDWFEENIKLSRVFELVRRSQVQERFQREVVADSVQLIDRRMQELVDWMVERNLKQWRAIIDYVNRRRQARYDEHLIGDVGEGFEYNRTQLLDSVGRTATQVVQGYDRRAESQQIAASLQSAVTQTVMAEVGAVGIGAAVIAMATTAAMDVTGILAAGIVAVLGLSIIPSKRRRARVQFREQTDALRRRLGDVLRHQFDSELDRSIERINDAIAPYTRFVRTEHERMREATEALHGMTEEIEALRAEIGAPRVSAS